MQYTPAILIYSTHLILQLQQLSLNKNRKYALASIDVDALYPNLRKRNCIDFCLEAFNLHELKIGYPTGITESLLAKLMNIIFRITEKLGNTNCLLHVHVHVLPDPEKGPTLHVPQCCFPKPSIHYGKRC